MRSPYLLKILLLLLGLVLLVELASYLTTRAVVRDTIMNNAESELKRGGEVFAQSVRARAEQLALSVRVLTEDFGFKGAVATRDAPTIRSALNNHAARIQADIAVVADEQGRVVASTQELAPDSWDFLAEYAQTIGRSGAHSTMMIADRPYQFVLAEMRAPLRIGVVGMGFEVDDDLTQELKRLTGLDISFVSLADQDSGYLSGTLTENGRERLLNLLHQEPPPPEQVVTTDNTMTMLLPVAQEPKALAAVLEIPLARALAPFSRLNQQLFAAALGFSVLAALLAYVIARSVTRPVSALARVARRVASGHYDTAVPVYSRDELGELAQGFTQMQTAIAERENRILYQARHDHLTGLINRGELFRVLEATIAQSGDTDKDFSLLVVDVDNFTRINDALSPEIGDQVLMEAARLLKSELGEEQSVARLGSDEFALILSDEQGSAEAFARTLLDRFARELNIKGSQLGIGLNIGIAHYPDHGEDPEILLRRANLALNRARADRQRVLKYQAGWDEGHLRRLQLFGDFKHSLDSGQISLHYQPKLSLSGCTNLGAEALVRWHHPELGAVSPEEFISVVESSGQIGLLTRWVLRTAVRRAAIWPESVSLSVNLSALDLQDPELPAFIDYLLKQEGVAPGRLWLEITESAIMQEAELSLATLRRLKNLGIKLSIDDFGTGYSSLSQLKKLPVSELKIDKSFVLDLDQSEDDQVIVQSTIDLGHTLGLSITAEGIENQMTEALLIQYGCDQAQGYYYSRPLPTADFEQWLQVYLYGNAEIK